MVRDGVCSLLDLGLKYSFLFSATGALCLICRSSPRPIQAGPQSYLVDFLGALITSASFKDWADYANSPLQKHGISVQVLFLYLSRVKFNILPSGMVFYIEVLRYLR